MIAIIIVCGLIGGLFIWGGLDLLKDWRKVGSWNKVRAQVLAKGAKRSEQPSSTRTAEHEIDITYQYQIGETVYTSSNYSIVHSLMPEKEAKFKAAQIPDTISVYVNPNNAEEVYYKRPAPWLGLVLLGVGIISMLIAWSIWNYQYRA